jgi:hypothetical protein
MDVDFKQNFINENYYNEKDFYFDVHFNVEKNDFKFEIHNLNPKIIDSKVNDFYYYYLNYN